jgi:hypothetical protein
MVSTRQSPEKEPPAGVPTQRRKPLSCRDQAVVRAERAERAERRAQAMQANPPVQEDTRPSTLLPLRTQPSPPSLSGGSSPPKPRLQQRGSQEDPDNDGVDVAVAAFIMARRMSMMSSLPQLAVFIAATMSTMTTTLATRSG